MFNLTDYPTDVRRAFRRAPAHWSAVVTHAFEDGTEDVDTLTDLVFFMHNRDRVVGGIGQKIDPSEADFAELIAEWKSFQSLVEPLVQALDWSGSGSRDSLAQDFTDFVREVRNSSGRELSAVDEMTLRSMLAPLSVSETKVLEWIAVLWPKFGSATKMNQIIVMVSDAIRKPDKGESKRGRFAEAEGAVVKRRLSKAAKATDFGQCLNFLASEGLDELYPDEQARVADAISRYVTVARDRKAERQAHGGGTLSLMASEMRLEGLVGPINLLKWRGSARRGRHENDPVELFDRLSGAGDGWYFFLCSAVSYHTFIIAVHATSGGSRRTYFEIQDGQSVRKSRARLKAWFDEEFLPNNKLASSRVWQVYREPQH